VGGERCVLGVGGGRGLVARPLPRRAVRQRPGGGAGASIGACGSRGATAVRGGTARRPAICSTGRSGRKTASVFIPLAVCDTGGWGSGQGGAPLRGGHVHGLASHCPQHSAVHAVCHTVLCRPPACHTARTRGHGDPVFAPKRSTAPCGTPVRGQGRVPTGLACPTGDAGGHARRGRAVGRPRPPWRPHPQRALTLVVRF